MTVLADLQALRERLDTPEKSTALRADAAVRAVCAGGMETIPQLNALCDALDAATPRFLNPHGGLRDYFVYCRQAQDEARHADILAVIDGAIANVRSAA